MSERKPNILILNPDQMRADYMTPAGHPFIDTRGLSRLAADALLMENAYCACPMCGPSRCSFLTGRYPPWHGSLDYDGRLDLRSPNALTNLRDAGYRLAIFGKDHVFKENPVGPVYHEGDQFCVGNLDKHPLSKRAWSSGVYEKGSEWDTTGRILSGSLAFLERTARAPETPFFLTLNFQDPHPFFACPEPYASLFKPEQFELPPNYRAKAEEGELRRLSLWREHSRGGEAGELELKKAMATYCGQIRYVDDAISSVLDKLDELGMADDTIVLFWSDHGDYLGEFGVTHKQAAYYDSLVHVPAILKDPTGRIAKGRRSSLTECMDLMASVLDLCGIPRPEGSLARSLVRDPSPRRDVFAAGGLRFKTPERPLPDILLRAPFQPSQYGPGAMLRTDEWKLCLYADGDAELFDMKNDTCEMRNLYSDQKLSDVREKLMARLASRLLCDGRAPEDLPSDSPENWKHRHSIVLDS